jgi:propane monooxygenase large subunit
MCQVTRLHSKCIVRPPAPRRLAARRRTLSRQSLTKAHAKITELSWEPTFATPATRFGTDYTFEKAPKKDPLKQILRSYFPMEEEKDNRVFGAMDGAIRGNMFRQVQQRWLEWQKLFLSIIPFPEISAARAMPMAIDAVPNPEIHNGLAVQMIDEVRHSTIQMNLKKLYMNNYIDPAGSTSPRRRSPTTTPAPSAGSSARGSSPVTRSPRPIST